jgi:acetyl esterase/lipase
MFGGQRVKYGSERNQFGVLRAGHRRAEPQPIVVFVHGGSWAVPYNRWVMGLLVRDARRRGWVTFNVEYRKLGRFGGGGGWPQTFDDVRDAIELITEGTHGRAQAIDPARVVVVGHSAGAHLALCALGTSTHRPPARVVAMAGPTDLEQISANGSATVDALVANAPEANRWKLTSPVEMLPFNAPIVCVHGEADTTVYPWNSKRLVDLGAADAVFVPNETHVDALKPKSAMWAAVVLAVSSTFL